MKSNGVHFLPGDVLYGRLRPYLNKVYRADFEGACSAEFIVFGSSQHLDSDFLKYLLHQRSFVSFASHIVSGDRPRVDFDAISDFSLGLPPTNEQERIVAKIDELLSDIDKGEENLKRVQVLLKCYRQSVLKAAVTGEQTRDWREKHGSEGEKGEDLLKRIIQARREAWEAQELAKMSAKGHKPKNDKWKEKYKEPEGPDTTNLPELPEGWVWCRLGQIGKVTGGLTKNSKRAELPKLFPYLRVANVYANRLELNEIHEIGVKESELERVLLKEGDLLVVEGNGSLEQIGRVAIWDGSVSHCVHQNHLIKVRFLIDSLSYYSLIWMLSPLGREKIQKVSSSTSGLHTLSISKVKSIPVPLPPCDEIDPIIDKFEAMTSTAIAAEMQLIEEIKRSVGLRQSILKSAFSGKLVPQDPNDEPASVLLERIKAEMESRPKASGRRGRPRKARKKDNKEAAA